MGAGRHGVCEGRQGLAGVKRQYSGTLGKIGNCQIGVSVHAVGAKGTVPLGWALYLPEEWCEDTGRRAKAKIPAEVEFKTKPELGVELVESAAEWEIPSAPLLGDQAYGDNTESRERLQLAGSEYVLAVGGATGVFAPETRFAVPEPTGKRGRPSSRPRPDRRPEAIAALAARLGAKQWQTVSFRDGPDGEPVTSRFAFVRVRAANRADKRTPWPPREEWLICEWPETQDAPTDYWLSNLPEDTEPERLARLARLRWKIELDYKQLKGELGLDHYEGRSWLGWHHHTALVTAAHGLSRSSACTLFARGRPDLPGSGATAATPVQVLGRPLPNLLPTRRPRPPAPAPRQARRATANKALIGRAHV